MKSGVLQPLHHLAELLLSIRVYRRAGRGLAQREGHGGGFVIHFATRLRRQGCGLRLVLGAAEVVPERVFAVVCLLASLAGTLEAGLVRLRASLGPSLEDLFGEHLGRDRRERSNTALQVVATRERCKPTKRGHRPTGNTGNRVTYCQSPRIWPLCRSPLRKATWQVLHVYGCVAPRSAVKTSPAGAARLLEIVAIVSNMSRVHGDRVSFFENPGES